MTTLEHSRFATTRETLAVRAVNAVSDLYRSWKNRRAFYRLGEMSDTELADIGLTRADLSVAINMPFGADPTERLRHITDARFTSVEEAARRVA